MPKSYSHLRAQMSPAAQAQAAAQATAMEDAMPDPTLTCAAERAYAVWFRHTFPLAPSEAAYAWQLLDPATRALWEQVAQAVARDQARPMPDPTLATLLDRVEALSLFVGYDPACHVPLDEIVTIEERLRTMDTALELMQGQLAEVLALLKGKPHA
jgi:hypothetical protein